MVSLPPTQTPDAPPSRTRRGPAGGLSGTAWSLAALGAGLVLGLLLHGSSQLWVSRATDIIDPIGRLWVAALRMIVIPLVVTQMLAAIGGLAGERSIGLLGGKTLLLFVLMLISAALFTLLVAPPLVSLYPVNAQTASLLRAATSGLESTLDAARGKSPSLGDWLIGLIPRNVFQSLASGEILPVLLMTVVFGLAVTHLAPERREPLTRIFRSLADVIMVVVAWILKVTPLGVFCLAYGLTIRAGIDVTGFLSFYVVLVSGVILLCAALLYPVTAFFGRLSLSRFARAVLPAQLVAVSTRSSLASLPALVEGAQEHLKLPATSTGFVLPLSVATFKLNRMISSPIKLLLLGHVFHLHLGPRELAAFLATEFVVSFSTLGLPGGGGGLTGLPAYLAAGVPLEGILILDAVDTIPDIFKTLLNVTADMSAATILSRSTRLETSA